MTVAPHAIRFETATGTLHVDGRSIQLTGIEKRMIALFVERLGIAISHQEIRTLVWGEGWNGGDEALRVTVNRLRRKIEGNQRKPEVLISVRGIGYKLAGYRAN
ncbi:MAG: winged helix-turn-helix domain-containing protein [Chloroflexota bacterium]